MANRYEDRYEDTSEPDYVNMKPYQVRVRTVRHETVTVWAKNKAEARKRLDEKDFDDIDVESSEITDMDVIDIFDV
jgi:hypothetical protein